MAASTAAPWAVLLPGILMPAIVRYAPLVGALAPEVRAVPKELEVYAQDAPPDDYSVASELAGLKRFLDERGVKGVHLYGHSAGASVALAFAAEHPERVLSLALDEPASDFSHEDRVALREQFPQRLEDLPAADRMRLFAHSLVRPGVQLPAPTPPAPGPESAKRPQGLLAFERALHEHELNVSALRLFSGPMYFSYGSLSNARWSRCRRGCRPGSPAAGWSGTTDCTTSTPRTRPSRPGSPTRCTSSGRRRRRNAEAQGCPRRLKRAPPGRTSASLIPAPFGRRGDVLEPRALSGTSAARGNERTSPRWRPKVEPRSHEDGSLELLVPARVTSPTGT